MKRVYVAASSAELDRAERAMRMLEARGVRVTYDWVLEVRTLRDFGISDDQLSDAAAEVAAELCVTAVETADALLFLAPTKPTRGAWVELGVAHALGIPIAIAGSGANQSIFTRLAKHRFATDAEAIDWIASASESAEASV